MNEQDLILREKIEKRERFDIILAYILIVVLVACIGIVLYLKFIRKEETVVDEYTPTYISLNEVSTSLNSSMLANRYLNDGATFSSNVSGNAIVVTYTKEDNVVNLNIPVVGNELEVVMNDTNTEVVTDIYKEITNIICVYYGNNEDNCRNTINNISIDNSISGIRFVNNTVYIDITKGISVSNDTVNRISVNSTDYSVSSSNVSITNINAKKSDSGILFNGKIKKLTEDNFSFFVVVKLYDVNGKVLDENTLIYNEKDLLEESVFTAQFMFNKYKKEDVSEYSIEIVR